MSKVLLNYAVAFNQVLPVGAASTAFLNQLGVVAKPAADIRAVALDGSGLGTTTEPAILQLSGLYLTGDIIDATFESDVPFIGQAPLTMTEDTTAADAAILWADLIKGIDQLTAVADGEQVLVYAFNGGIDVTVTAPTFTDGGALFTPSVEVITDPDAIKYYTDADIAGAFDGGLTRIYLILAEDAAEIPALIDAQECEFYTVYGSIDFTGSEYEAAFSTWEGVRAWTSNDEASAATWAAELRTCIFYEDTIVIGEVKDYFGLFAFGNLLASAQWRNQQYIGITAANGNPVAELGKANLLFDERVSFYLTDEEQGTRLAFFVAGGQTITTPYINMELQVTMQSKMLTFISANQPLNIETNRRLLEQVGQRVIDDYLDNGLLDPSGENVIVITTSNELFIVTGNMETTEATALWRVEIDAINQVGL